MPHHIAGIEMVVSLALCLIVTAAPASAVIRFQNRSLEITNPNPGVTTTYKLSMQFTTTTKVGSVNMLFCIDPIPYLPCEVPQGLDVSHATLTSQTGETGFSISSQNANHIVLSRTAPSTVGTETSTYTFTGVVNPKYMDHSFAIRLSDYASTDATGPLIDQGAVVTQIQTGIGFETQVPPLLIFCLGRQVSDNCADTTGGNYTDMGILDPTDTLTAQSQMAAGTNASNGYVITVSSIGMAAGTHVIDSPSTPTMSTRGTNQFGMNLVANNLPNVGANPDGQYTNAVVTSDYDQPNRFMFHDGDVVASAPNVSLFRRYTVSYIVNAAANLPPGVYSTTLTYICSGRF